MARRERKAAAAVANNEGAQASAADKIAGLLALVATKDMETEEAALKLDAIGFSAHEISALLDVGPNYVNVARHRKKAGGKKKSRSGSG